MGAKAFGVQSPTAGEDPVSWQTWSDGAAGIPDVDGNADWGKLKLDLSGEEGRSAVYDLGSEATRKFTLTENRYGTGDQDAVLEIRGDTSSFNQDDAAPDWEVYSAAISRSWRYVQVRETTEYTEKVRELFGANLTAYWPRIYDGVDVSGNERDGTATALTAVAGVGDGQQASSFNGTTSILTCDTPMGLTSGTEGGFGIFAKVSDVADWADGANRYGLRFSGAGGVYVYALKGTTASQFSTTSYIGGTLLGSDFGTFNPTPWFHVGMTWSQSNNRVRSYLNGRLTEEGAYNGAFDMTQFRLGSAWKGTLAHCWFTNAVEPTAAQMRQVASPSWRSCIISYLGDSITAISAMSYTRIVCNSYPAGVCSYFFNHAVGGESVIADMDDQVVEAASDDASIIIIELGTNDANGGDMAALQAEVEENLSELKTSNPNATLYYMNVLPRWTDSGGGTEIVKGNIRTAIAAACAAQSVTCWDTYTTPWITAADTSDGTHPTADGHIKIAAEVVARLP